MSDEEDFALDAELYRSAIKQVREDLIKMAKQIGQPRSAQDLVDLATELRANAERFDSLVRGVLDFQQRVCL